MTARDALLARRRSQRAELIERARTFLRGVGPGVELVAAAIFGSVARGDFNRWSDVDLLVVAAHLPDDPVARLALLGDRPPLVEPVVWTAQEWATRTAASDPIARECRTHGVWLVGSPAAIELAGDL